MDTLALLLSRLVPLLLLFSACLFLGRFSFDRLRGWSTLVARWVFAGFVLLGPALAVPYVARLWLRFAAERAYAGRRWEDADQLFLRYRELHGHETETTRFHWAVSLMNLRQWRAAEEVLLSAAPAAGSREEIPPPLRVQMGICLYYEGRAEAAEENLHTPTDPAQIYLSDYFLGRLAERRGDANEAIDWYKTSLGRAPYFYPAIYQVVRLLLLRGNVKLARGVVLRFLQGEDRPSRERLARALIDAVSGEGPIPAEREFLIVQH